MAKVVEERAARLPMALQVSTEGLTKGSLAERLANGEDLVQCCISGCFLAMLKNVAVKNYS